MNNQYHNFIFLFISFPNSLYCECYCNYSFRLICSVGIRVYDWFYQGFYFVNSVSLSEAAYLQLHTWPQVSSVLGAEANLQSQKFQRDTTSVVELDEFFSSALWQNQYTGKISTLKTQCRNLVWQEIKWKCIEGNINWEKWRLTDVAVFMHDVWLCLWREALDHIE